MHKIVLAQELMSLSDLMFSLSTANNLKAQAKFKSAFDKRVALSMNQAPTPIADSYEQDIKNAEKEQQDALALKVFGGSSFLGTGCGQCVHHVEVVVHVQENLDPISVLKKELLIR